MFTIANLAAILRLTPDAKSFKVGDRLLDGIKGQLTSIVGLAAAVSGAIGAAKDFLNFDEALTDLDIAAAGALGSIADFRDQLLGVSTDTGVTKEKVLEVAAGFVRLTGDGKTATDAMDTFARVMKASGAQGDDVAGTAAAMAQAFGLTAKDFELGFSMMIRAGKAGSVELKQLATVLPELGGLFTQFAGGKGTQGLAELTAALQVVAVGTGGSADKAKTQVQALLSSFISNADKFKDKGIHIFDKDGELKNFRDIIGEISRSKLAKDETALSKAFGSIEAFNAYIQLAKEGGKAWDDITVAQQGATDVADDYAKKSKSLSAIVKKTWNTISNVVTKASIVIAENIELITAAIGALLITLGIWLVVTKSAAIAQAALAVVSMLPWLALAALILGLILIVEDLYYAFTGGESVLKDLYEDFVEWLGRAWEYIKKWADDVVGKVKETVNKAAYVVSGGLFGGDAFGLEKREEERRLRANRLKQAKGLGIDTTNRFDVTPDELLAAARAEAERGRQAAAALAEQQRESQVAARIAQLQAEVEMEKQGILAPRGGGVNIQQNNVINDATNPEKVRGIIREENDRLARELNGAAGEGEEYH